MFGTSVRYWRWNQSVIMSRIRDRRSWSSQSTADNFFQSSGKFFRLAELQHLSPESSCSCETQKWVTMYSDMPFMNQVSLILCLQFPQGKSMWMRTNSLLTQTFSMSSVDASRKKDLVQASELLNNLRRTPAAGEYNLRSVSFPEAKVVVVALRSWPVACWLFHARTSKTDSFARDIERLVTLAMLHSCYHKSWNTLCQFEEPGGSQTGAGILKLVSL